MTRSAIHPVLVDGRRGAVNQHVRGVPHQEMIFRAADPLGGSATA